MLSHDIALAIIIRAKVYGKMPASIYINGDTLNSLREEMNALQPDGASTFNDSWGYGDYFMGVKIHTTNEARFWLGD